MMSEDEARTAYDELLEQLRSLGAKYLVAEIERTVGVGRLQERGHKIAYERQPETGALAIALRMLATWVETGLLASEAETHLREDSDARVTQIRWLPDRFPNLQLQGDLDSTAALVETIPPLGASPADIRRHLDRLQALAAELCGTPEGNSGWEARELWPR